MRACASWRVRWDAGPALSAGCSSRLGSPSGLASFSRWRPRLPSIAACPRSTSTPSSTTSSPTRSGPRTRWRSGPCAAWTAPSSSSRVSARGGAAGGGGGSALSSLRAGGGLGPRAGGAAPNGPARDPARLRTQFATYRRARSHGLVQRFLAYLERDFARWLRPHGGPEPLAGVHVVAAGPNAFVYFTDSPEPLRAEEIERRFPGGAAALSRHRGIGLVLARAAGGPVCRHAGGRGPLGAVSGGGPFANRGDREVVVSGLRELMDMPSTGDLVLYGIGAPVGDVSFLDERGAHAGPSEAELQTFIFHPPSVALPALPLTHPVQLYPHFAAYGDGARS